MRLALLFFWSSCIVSFAFADQMKTIRAQYANIHYPSDYEPLAIYVQQNIDGVIEEVWGRLQASQIPITDVYINNAEVSFNAYASVLFEPVVGVEYSPFIFGELQGNQNVILDTLRHELTHSVSSRVSRGLPEFYSLFGYHPFSVPNALVPRGFQEGMAQVVESDRKAGAGRGFALNSYYNTLWLSEWRNGFMSFSDFADIHDRESGVRAYLYGAYFFSYITERFGDQAIVDWLAQRANDGGAIRNPLFGLNYSWEQAFGEPLQASWADFIAHEDVRLGALYGRDRTELNVLMDDVGGYRGEGLVDVYQDVDSHFVIAPITRLGKRRFSVYENGQEIETLNLTNAWQIRFLNARTLVYSAYSQCDDTQVIDLYRLDIEKKRSTQLTRCEQVLAFDTSAHTQAIVALVKDGSGSVLKSYDLDGEVIDSYWSGDFQQQFSTLALNPAGDRLIASRKMGLEGNWNLYELDLTRSSWRQLTDDRNIQRSPTFVGESRVVYSREANHIEQIFQLDLVTGIETQLTAVNTGLLSPNILGNTLYALALNDMRLQLVAPLVNPGEYSQTAVFKPLAEPSPAANAPEVISQSYRLIEKMNLQMALPLLSYASDGGVVVRLMALVADPLLEHRVSYIAQANLESGEVIGSLDYAYKQEFSARLLINSDDERYTTGYQLDYQKPILKGDTLFTPMLGVTTINIHDGIDSAEDQWFSTGFEVQSLEHCRQFTLACQGWRAVVLAENKNGLKNTEVQNNLALATQGYFSLGHGLAARGTIKSRYAFEGNKFSLGRVEAPVLTPEIPAGFNQRGYANPLTGSWLSQIDVRITKEWAPSRTLGTTGFGLKTMNMTPFAMVGFDDSRYQSTVGAELSLTSELLWTFPLSASLGYARGLQQGGEDDIYFQIGVNF